MNFSNFGFKKFINDSLQEINFEEPTKVQEKVIPLIKKHQTVVCQSHTGTGKTHAFLLPIINNLNPDRENQTQFVIFAPTRELARQIFENIKQLIKYQQKFTASIFVGGDDIKKQQERLTKKQPTIIIGTPTRLRELYETNYLKITTTDYIVVDECDMIFDLGFIDDLDFIIAKCKSNVEISVFSATIKNELKPFLTKYLSRAQVIEIMDKKPSNKNIVHSLIWTKNRENKDVLKIIINKINPYIAIIFVNKKSDVSQIVGWLKEFGIKNVGELHGDLDPRQRLNMQKRIQNQDFKWIVASDVAARGIDIDGVSHIISIDLPQELEYYIHRSGRTGRNKYTGESFVLFNNDNQYQIDKLRSIGVNFKNYKLSNSELVEVNPRVFKKRPVKGSSKTDIEIRHEIAKNAKQKVKPGYKKKLKNKIDNIKKQARRQHIKESIEKIKKERYKQRRQDLFDEE